MFENLKKIKVQGGCFDVETELELFKGTFPLSVVYGRNGSGKSTIAHCLKQLAENKEEIEQVGDGVQDSLRDYKAICDIAIGNEYKTGIFVFDEDFLRNKVRIEENGLNAIVMLGEQVELSDRIKIKTEELKEKEEEFSQQEELVKKYGNSTEIISPQYYWNQIRNGLRAEGGWADIDRDLKRNIQKSRITDDVVDLLMGMNEPEETYEHLREQVLADKRLYMESENSQTIEWSPGEVILPNDLEELIAILGASLDSPQLTEREQRLMDLITTISQDSQHFDHNHTQHMLENEWGFCPLCLREITEKDRTTISETLTHLLNKEAEEFNMRLNVELNLFSEIRTDMPFFSGDLNKTELRAAITAKDELNKILDTIREKIELRKSDIYKALQSPFTDKIEEAYVKALIDWKLAIESVRKSVDRFNEVVNKRNELYRRVRHENNLLARKQLSSPLAGYKMALENEKKDKRKLQELEGQKNNLIGSIKELKTQLERTDIALEYINKELQYVFYSNRKLKLIPGDGHYKLTVNGRQVKPKNISVGERNVLGLCYFFAMLFSGKREDDKYASEYLIIIDDPISSFDYGNRLGVMSLLRYQFSNIIKGNANSRLLVMSHDLQSVFDLVKIRSDINGKRGEKKFLELENKELKEHSVRNEYQKLLKHVYQYASCECPDDSDETLETSIGNIMRRMLEAFSSFCYNESFETMMRMEDVLRNIPADKQAYYENFMCRLALNGESHEEERTYTLSNFASFFTKKEKCETAKNVLLFLLYVNEPHIKAYLTQDMVRTIESWKNNER